MASHLGGKLLRGESTERDLAEKYTWHGTCRETVLRGGPTEGEPADNTCIWCVPTGNLVKKSVVHSVCDWLWLTISSIPLIDPKAWLN
jgi:hypothetical protein